MKIPDGFTAVSPKTATGLVQDNAAVWTPLIVRTLANTNTIEFIRFDIANFALSAANTHIRAQIALEVR